MTRVARTLDATRLNEVANHPDVRPWLGGSGVIDLKDIVGHPANVALVTANGGYVLQNQGGGQYEAHSLFLPDGRGSEAAAAAEEGFRYLFASTDCIRVVTKVPAGNAAAAAHARRCGFAEVFSRDGVWPGVNGPEAISYQALTFDAWKANDPEVVAAGAWFHELLENAKRERGSALEIHDDDEAHDRAVGAAVLMLRAGNVAKAATLYNQWAAFSGYAPLSVLSLTPLVIDAVDAVLEVTAQGAEVLLCR